MAQRIWNPLRWPIRLIMWTSTGAKSVHELGKRPRLPAGMKRSEMKPLPENKLIRLGNEGVGPTLTEFERARQLMVARDADGNLRDYDATVAGMRAECTDTFGMLSYRRAFKDPTMY